MRKKVQTINEIWVPIAGFENTYEISNLGRVKSFKYGKERIMKTPVSDNGYEILILCKNGVHYKKSVHRLVANAFVPNPEFKREVNHIDGNKRNNSVTNLEWVTPSENQIHSRKTGLSPTKPIDMLSLDGSFLKTFFSTMEAQRQTGINSGHINSCCTGKRKTAGGYKWQYHEK